MTLVRHSFERKPKARSLASGTAAGEAMQRPQQHLMHIAYPQRTEKQQLAEARAAIARSRALLAQSTGRAGAVVARPQLTGARGSVPSLRSEREIAMTDPQDLGSQDLGKEIAAAILRLVPDVIDEHGLIFEIADPEPVLRGVASAYAAIAYALPGGRSEAWALLGLLAIELEEGDRTRPQPEAARG